MFFFCQVGVTARRAWCVVNWKNSLGGKNTGPMGSSAELAGVFGQECLGGGREGESTVHHKSERVKI